MPDVSRRLRAAGMTAAATVLAGGVLTTGAFVQAASATQVGSARAAISGTEPTWANASTRMTSVQAAATGTMSARVYLAGRTWPA